MSHRAPVLMPLHCPMSCVHDRFRQEPASGFLRMLHVCTLRRAGKSRASKSCMQSGSWATPETRVGFVLRLCQARLLQGHPTCHLLRTSYTYNIIYVHIYTHIYSYMYQFVRHHTYISHVYTDPYIFALVCYVYMLLTCIFIEWYAYNRCIHKYIHMYVCVSFLFVVAY